MNSLNLTLDISTREATLPFINVTNIISTALPPEVRVTLALIAACLSFLALTLNSLLILAIIRSRALRTPTNLFLCSLAAGETLVGLGVLPLAAVSVLVSSWPFSQTACSLSASLHSLGRSSSTLSLMSVCLDRCIAVSRPLKYPYIITLRSASAILLVAWIFALVMALLPVGCSWGRYAYEHAHFMCVLIALPNGRQNFTREIIFSFIPAAIMATSLLQIVREVRSHHRIFSVVPLPVAMTSSSATGSGPGITRISGYGPGGGTQGESIPGLVMPLGPRSFNRNTIRAMRSLFIVTLGYALFSLPANIVNSRFNQPGRALTDHEFIKQEQASREAFGSEGTTKVPLSGGVIETVVVYRLRPYVTATAWLSFLCCVLNPFVVFVLNRKFRIELKALFSCRRFVKTFMPSKEVFTISTGLHSILEATLYLNMLKKEQASTIASTRRKILGSVQA